MIRGSAAHRHDAGEQVGVRQAHVVGHVRALAQAEQEDAVGIDLEAPPQVAERLQHDLVLASSP